MIFLVFLCEGETESDFVSQVLSPHLLNHGVISQPFLFGKKIKHDHPEAPGGIFKYDPVYKHIMRELRSHRAPTSYVTTLMDFYAFPRDFPDYEALAQIKIPFERVIAFETAMKFQVNDSRFIPHIQLHEFEALVLSNLDALTAEFAEAEEVKALKQLVANVDGLNPEEVNQTPEGAPSKRLLRFLPDYNKRATGLSVVKRTGLAYLRQACPHFGNWLSTLESLSVQK